MCFLFHSFLVVFGRRFALTSWPHEHDQARLSLSLYLSGSLSLSLGLSLYLSLSLSGSPSLSPWLPREVQIEGEDFCVWCFCVVDFVLWCVVVVCFFLVCSGFHVSFVWYVFFVCL